jgi:hypothetical protein
LLTVIMVFTDILICVDFRVNDKVNFGGIPCQSVL